MTTVLSKKGQIVLPASIREKLNLRPGDDFEILLEDDGTITLRRITHPPNHGLIEHLMSCPFPIVIPERSKELPRDVDLG